ncbi:uncharacterized protein LOC142471029 [Ascaphus truei]|uniref:uncharacterized protein LOC142471029 n=1 Tax=Ascaphus truei TaxID=8439 RepID=UPI003F5A0229
MWLANHFSMVFPATAAVTFLLKIILLLNMCCTASGTDWKGSRGRDPVSSRKNYAKGELDLRVKEIWNYFLFGASLTVHSLLLLLYSGIYIFSNYKGPYGPEMCCTICVVSITLISIPSSTCYLAAKYRIILIGTFHRGAVGPHGVVIENPKERVVSGVSNVPSVNLCKDVTIEIPDINEPKPNIKMVQVCQNSDNILELCMWLANHFSMVFPATAAVTFLLKIILLMNMCCTASGTDWKGSRGRDPVSSRKNAAKEELDLRVKEIWNYFLFGASLTVHSLLLLLYSGIYIISNYKGPYGPEMCCTICVVSITLISIPSSTCYLAAKYRIILIGTFHRGAVGPHGVVIEKPKERVMSGESNLQSVNLCKDVTIEIPDINEPEPNIKMVQVCQNSDNILEL